MNLQPESRATAANDERPDEARTRLHGRWLVIARAGWVVMVLHTLSIFIVSLPAYFAQLQTVCTGVTCVYSYGQLTAGSAQALQNMGFSISAYAASTFALIFTSALISFGVAGLIFWRRSDDWTAILASLFLITFGVNFIAQAQGSLEANAQTAWTWSLSILIGFGYVSLCLLLYIFPDGKFVPRWTRPMAVFVVASNFF
jgi:hypothetical protein